MKKKDILEKDQDMNEIRYNEYKKEKMYMVQFIKNIRIRTNMKIVN